MGVDRAGDQIFPARLDDFTAFTSARSRSRGYLIPDDADIAW